MPGRSPDPDLVVRQKRGTVGLKVAAGAPPEEIARARAELAEAVLEARIARLIADAPPLSPEKRVKLAALLAPESS